MKIPNEIKNNIKKATRVFLPLAALIFWQIYRFIKDTPEYGIGGAILPVIVIVILYTIFMIMGVIEIMLRNTGSINSFKSFLSMYFEILFSVLFIIYFIITADFIFMFTFGAVTLLITLIHGNLIFRNLKSVSTGLKDI